MLKRRIGLLLGGALALTIATPQSGRAIGPYQMWDYYSDATFTTHVGYKYRICTSLQQGGQVTPYYQFIDGDCEYGGGTCSCSALGYGVYGPPCPC
ncbi:MAG: hypothetical protein ABW221_04810 [Vicinamibacteria bacterium]